MFSITNANADTRIILLTEILSGLSHVACQCKPLVTPTPETKSMQRGSKD